MGGKEMRPGKEGRNYLESKAALQEKILVPSKGLEPPHRCRYMDLNHARLPIPPRWQSELQCSGGPKAAVSGRLTPLFYSPVPACQTKRPPRRRRDAEKNTAI